MVTEVSVNGHLTQSLWSYSGWYITMGMCDRGNCSPHAGAHLQEVKKRGRDRYPKTPSKAHIDDLTSFYQTLPPKASIISQKWTKQLAY